MTGSLLTGRTVVERIALHSAALRVIAALKTAAPHDVESLAAAAYIAVTVWPDFDEAASYARELGVAEPDPEAWAAARSKLLEVASLVTFGPEVSH